MSVELHVAWTGAPAPAVAAEVQRRVAEYLARTARLPSVTVDVVVAGVAPAETDARRHLGPHPRDDRLAPPVCRDCVWWQSRGNRTASKERWAERAEEDFGEWGTIYLDDDGRLLGSMQYGPSHLFPRAADLPAGPASDDAVLVTCAYLMRDGVEWIEKSLLLAAIGESRDRGAKAIEAFAYRYPEGESVDERFLVHRTVFPRDFLDEFGFTRVRSQGRVELCRLELGGLVPVEEGRRAKVLRVVQDAFTPSPARRRSRAPEARQAARAATPSSNSSAIWIALSAAPLRRLSLER